MRYFILAVLVIFFLQPALATTIHVPGDQPTIQAGIDASNSADTILVGPGTYQENVLFNAHNVKVIGSGPENTILMPLEPDQPAVSFMNSETLLAELRDITVAGGTGDNLVLISNDANPNVRHCVFRDFAGVGSSSVVMRITAAGIISYNLFYQNGGTSCIGISGDGHPDILNNTFDDNNRGLNCTTAMARVENNIITNSIGYGINGRFLEVDYNCVRNNNPDYNGYVTAGVHDISADPLYVDPASADYHLQLGSPCIDAGDPYPLYNDPDGTISDMGAFYFDQAGLNVWQINVGGADPEHVVSNTPTIYWSFRDNTVIQYAYEIEVGTDADWTTAELWATGEVISPDTEAVYAGAALQDGETYFIRLRVSNGTDWDPWRITSFHMNVAPSEPVPLSPIAGDESPAIYTELQVSNSIDMDGDALHYEFEVYSDPAMTDLIWGETDVAEGTVSSRSGPVSGLVEGGTYWWRARSTDGFETSPWSGLESFVAGSIQVLRVPEDFPTIQSAIDAADSTAQIDVAAGEYPENIDYSGKHLRIIGAGADVTRLSPTDPNFPGVIINAGETGFAGLSGFTISGGNFALIYIGNGADPLITNCVFRDFRGSIAVIRVMSDATITRNLFYHNGGISCIAISNGGRADIINNTFDSNARGFHTVTGRGRALNNIVTNSQQYGIYGSFEELDYNCVWNNNPDYTSGATPGDHDIQSDPVYEDPLTDEYSLLPGSPCIDAGHPDSIYNDPDGSRNDMGAFPFDVTSFPVAIRLNLGDGVDIFHVLNHTPTIYWSYFDPTAGQEAYQIEIGDDSDWTAAEQWASGEVASSDTSVVYDGDPLLDGVTYYLRIRVSNGVKWGNWTAYQFTMNNTPQIPILYTPDDGGNLSISDMRVAVVNPSDTADSNILYDFEIYRDEDLAQLLYVKYDVPDQAPYIWSDILYMLKEGTTYWWRARARGPIETSDWSGPWSFTLAIGQALHVPADYATIQEAISAASDGDVIEVAPGTYIENLDFLGKLIKVIGAGPDESYLTPAVTGNHAVWFQSGEGPFAEIRGFTISGGTGSNLVDARDGAQPLIRDNVFTNYLGGGKADDVVIRVYSDAFIVGNLFYNNGGISCIGINFQSTATIINNTFDRNNRGFHTVSHHGVAINNIVTNSVEYGIYGDFTTLDYNCVWNNNPDYTSGASAGEHSISEEPQFLAPEDGLYSLSPESPCVDAADPQPQYNDADGTRGDIGAYPIADLGYPVAWNINWCGQDPQHVVYHMCDISWKYLDSPPTSSQTAYEVEVGTDSDWTVAEMWSSGEVYTSDTFALYIGEYLENGVTYYLRVRVNNGEKWGNWRDFTFRMNTEPTIPVQAWPPGGSEVEALSVNLSVANATDAEGDTLTYSFEVYNTRNINDIAAQIEGIAEQQDFTASGVVPGLDPGHDYWWRARAYDGYEYSRWTPFDSFTTTAGTIIRVPEDMPTIQAAINAAANGNIVLVSPGEYTENINFNGKEVRLRSSGGPDVTILSPEYTGGPVVTMLGGESGPTEISGFTFTGSVGWGTGFTSYMRISVNASPLITKNVFRNITPFGEAAFPIILDFFHSQAVVKNNIFHNNDGVCCIYVDAGRVAIENNTFDRNFRGIKEVSGYGSVKNNIISNSDEFGINAATPIADCDYNCLWQNYPNYDDQAVAGPHSISDDPSYVDYSTFNYRLGEGSPCINAGDPETFVPYYGGTAIDMGAYEYYFWPGGDANIDGEINIADAIYIVNYIFKGGPAPGQLAFADCNADCKVNISDAVFLIQYIFQGGPFPMMGCAYQYEMNDDAATLEMK